MPSMMYSKLGGRLRFIPVSAAYREPFSDMMTSAHTSLQTVTLTDESFSASTLCMWIRFLVLMLQTKHLETPRLCPRQ